MIPNIHNKAVFDSEFDLERSHVLRKSSDGSQVFYRVKRNSDLLEYCLLLIDYPHPATYNAFLQNVLNAIPASKAGSCLEIYTIYAWEQQKIPKVAILTEKFDEFLQNHEFSNEKELFDTLGKTLKIIANSITEFAGLCHLESLVLRNKAVKLLALDGLANSGNKGFLLLESNPMSHIVDFFKGKNAKVKSQNVAKILDILTENQNNLETVLEENFQEAEFSLGKHGKTLNFAPPCAFCASDSKKSDFFCKNPECMKAFCADCLKTHRKTHPNKDILEFEEFLKSEITAGDSLKLLEDTLTKIPALESAVEEKYSGLNKELEKFFSFLEIQILKLLKARKEGIFEELDRCKEEDLEKLRVIEKELSKQRKDLVKLRETNEVRTPYLQEDLDKFLAFQSDFRFEFQGEFNKKLEGLSMKKQNPQDLMHKLTQRNSDFTNIMMNFARVLENILKFPAPFLDSLDIEKLRNASLEVKPVFYAKTPENSRVKRLISLEEAGFLGLYDGNEARIMSTASASAEFEKGALKNNGVPLKSIINAKAFAKDKIFLLVEKGLLMVDIAQDRISVARKIDGVFSGFEGFPEVNLVFLGKKNTEEIVSYSLLYKDQGIAFVLKPTNGPLGMNITALEKVDADRLISVAEISNEGSIIRLWDVNKRLVLRSNSIVNLRVTSLRVMEEEFVVGGFSPNAKSIKILIFSLLSFKECKMLLEMTGVEELISIEYSKKLSLLVACFAESGTLVWDLDRYYSRYQIKPILPFEKPNALRFTSICWARKDEVLVCGTESGDVFLVDLSWEMKKTAPFLPGNRQKSFFSKQSSDLTDFFEENKEFKEEIRVIDKKRKVSVMETKKIEIPGVKRAMDDSIFETAKAKIWMGKDKRKGTSICRVF